MFHKKWGFIKRVSEDLSFDDLERHPLLYETCESVGKTANQRKFGAAYIPWPIALLYFFNICITLIFVMKYRRKKQVGAHITL